MFLVVGSYSLFLCPASGWRATAFQACSGCQAYDFYPRPPGGGRLYRDVSHVMEQLISIHALRVEGDFVPWLNSLTEHEFLSTPSGWRATAGTAFTFIICLRFLSTPSGWRATLIEALDAAYDEFLSTPSGWRATLSVSIVVFSPTLFLSTPSGWRATFKG